MNFYTYVFNPNISTDPIGWIIVYRALNGNQEAQALANEPILPKKGSATYSIQEHIDNGRLETQYISTTKQPHTADYYAKPNPKYGKTVSSPLLP